jgi:hypothetical protein
MISFVGINYKDLMKLGQEKLENSTISHVLALPYRAPCCNPSGKLIAIGQSARCDLINDEVMKR